jgi:hypothetical protein
VLPHACVSSAAAAAALGLCAPAQRRSTLVGGACGVRICFIGKSDLVVSQNTLRGMHLAVTRSLLEHDDRSDRLDLRARDADWRVVTRIAGASRGDSPGPPRLPWADASVKRNYISCQPGAEARLN